MKKSLVLISTLLLSSCNWLSQTTHLSEHQRKRFEQHAHDLYVDFDTGMQAFDPRYAPIRHHSLQLYVFFKQLYERYNFTKVAVAADLKIPQVIHHIWLGSKLPEKYHAYYQTWRTFHPNWSFVFWTDNKENYEYGTQVVSSFAQAQRALSSARPQQIVVDVSGLEFDNRPFFDEAKNYGEKSDILRWDIVYQLGGMYVDTDYECLAQFDFLHYMYDFYTGLQPLDTNIVQLGAGLFAARAHHPILEHTVNTIKNNRHTQQIIVKTGPIHFTRSLIASIGKNNMIDVVLPANYLYPCGYEQRGTPQSVWRTPQSLAVHHWAGSWLEPEAFAA